VFLLYVDESGDVDDPNISHFVLSGFAIFERQTYWLSQELEKIAARFDEADPGSVELHGNPMVQGNKGWKQFPQTDRLNAIKDSLSALCRTHPSTKIFSIVVEKGSVSDGDPVEFAFEHLCNRFDRYLGRLHNQGNTQRGLLVVDRSSFEKRFQGLVQSFQTKGHRWGRLVNIAEVPLFADSRASRLIQLADLVSYSVFRHFEKQDDRFIPIIAQRFDREGQQLHGLVRWQNRSAASFVASTVTHYESHTVIRSVAARPILGSEFPATGEPESDGGGRDE